MTSMASPDTLTEAEVYERARALAPLSRFDADGILGFLHGVELGPGDVSSLTWLPRVLDQLVGADLETQKPHVAELMVLASCVRDRLEQKVPLAPGEHESARWASFCSGFVAYAAIDSAWRTNAKSWNYVVWAAVLARRTDLLGPMTPLRFGELTGKTQRELRDQKANMLVLAHEDLRLAKLRAATSARPGARVGRNDPCPCGSGKKFKKCHIDADARDGSDG